VVKALRFNVTTLRFVLTKAIGALLGKWVYYNSPLATITYVDIPEPELPTEEWVKIKTAYCGFCGSDLNLIFLHDSPTASPFTSFPCVIGHEYCGEIVALGKSVRDFKVGDLVTYATPLPCAARDISPACPSCKAGRPNNCENFAEGSLPPGMFLGICSAVNGGFAPYIVAHKSQLFKLPRGTTYESGALIEPLSVALEAVLDNIPERGDRVLIIGGGVIGNMIVKAIHALDIHCTITVIEPSPFHAAFIKKSGIDNLVTGNVYQSTVEITGAKSYKPLLGSEILMGGFNRIFDTVASSGTLNMSMRILAANGVLSVVGIGGDVKLDLTPLWLKHQTVKGVFAFGMTTFKGKKRHIFDIAIELVKKKKVMLDEMVTHRFRLEDYREMIEVNMNKAKHRAVKTVISFL
jgi:(R,R)-butanediol dehydrogenase/meso-butanediol dehydrogenase/diacetyl reductase